MKGTEKNDEIIERMWRAGEPVKRIAEATGLGLSTVKWRRQRLGLAPRNRGATPSIDDVEVLRLAESGLSMVRIAKLLGCSRDSVASSLARSRNGDVHIAAVKRKATPRTCIRCRETFMSRRPPAEHRFCNPCEEARRSIYEVEHSLAI